MKNYTVQKNPTTIPTDDGKLIQEIFGHVANSNSDISIAKMVAPPGWSEPFQTPEFDEYTVILKGKKQFTIANNVIVLSEGEAIKINKNTRVQYANPFDEPCEYIAICLPAFSITSVHREEN